MYKSYHFTLFFLFFFYLLVSQHKEVKKKEEAVFNFFECETKVAGRQTIHLLKNDPDTFVGKE